MASYEWPPSGGGGGVSIYPTYADFPATATKGSLAVAADTGDLYEFNGTSWVLLASPSGSGPAPGSTGDMIYNSAGFFAADPDFTTNGTGTVSAVNLTLSGTLTNNIPMGQGSIFSSTLSTVVPAVQVDTSASTVSSESIYCLTDSNGYSDTHAIEVLWASGASAAPYESHVIEANIIGTGSSSGNVYGYFLNVVDPGSLTNLYAMGVGPGAGVITQRQGSVAAPLYALYYNGSTYASIKTGTNQIFINDNDYVYIGNSSTFGEISFIISIFASSTITPVFQYWNGAWTNIPATANLVDDSAGFTKQGNIYWESYILNDWVTTSVDSDSAYWIRIQRTAASLTTPPTETSILSSVITAFFWDPNGNVVVNNLVNGYAGTVPVGGTVNMTIASSGIQNTLSGGSGSTTFVLPNATTLHPGYSYSFVNDGSGITTIETYGGSTIFTMPAGSIVDVFLNNNSFSAGQWDWHWRAPKTASWGTAALTLGAGSNLNLQGSSSGEITIAPQSAAGTYNFNLPTTAGTSGYFLTSAGGGSSPMTWTNSTSVVPSQITVTQTSTNASFYPTFISGDTTGSYGLDVGTGLSFNPSTNILSTTGANLSGLTASYAVVTDGSKNLASLVYNAGVTNSSIVSRDTNGNSAFNNVVASVTTIVSSGQTIAMSAGSTAIQKITGTAAVTFDLPNATTIYSGTTYQFNNNSTQSISVYLNDGITLLTTVISGAYTFAINTNNSTVNGTWDVHGLWPTGTAWGSADLSLAAGTNLQLSGSSSGTVTVATQAAAGTYNFNLPTTAGTSGYALTSGGGSSSPMTWTSLTTGTVTSFSFTNQDNVTGTVTNSTSTPTLALAPTGTAPAASSFAAWDASENLTANNLISGWATTATAAGTTTLTVTSAQQQYFTGTTTQTVKLPTTSIVAGQSYTIVNNSTGVVTVQSSGSNTIQAMAAGTELIVTALVATPTTAANWQAIYIPQSQVLAGISPTVQKFTSGSGTYTTPSGVQFIRVQVLGGGGGGGASNGNNGGNGTASTFGSNISAGGGTGGQGYNNNNGNGGTGGVPTLTGLTGIATYGGGGQGAAVGNAYSGSPSNGSLGGAGGSSALAGGAPSNGYGNLAGATAFANTGGGGSGASTTGANGDGGGAGGGGGAYIDVIITSPASSYSYSVGGGGSSGSGGTNLGGAGGSGLIIVNEYYNNLAVGTTAAVTANYVLAGPSSGSAASPAFRALVTTDIPGFSCKYVNTAGTTISTTATVPFATKVYDTSGTTVSSGVFTAPFAGKFRITANFYIGSVNLSTSQAVYSAFLVTSTPEGLSAAQEFAQNIVGSGASQSRTIVMTKTYSLSLGDTVAAQMGSDVSTTLASTSGRNYLCIEWVGN
jgi:hypothetical protein